MNIIHYMVGYFVQSQGTMLDMIEERNSRVRIEGCSCLFCRRSWAGMFLCSKCGNKRCPKAQYHGFKCTNSNEPMQQGERE